MKNFFEQALNIQEEIIANRRALHQVPEIGFELPQTVAYVSKKLREYGYDPQPVGKSGISCLVGKAGKTILLRADMDALPMKEESGLPFASQNGHCHSCGHDCHTAMLLGAARLLKAREGALKGSVKFMFQPAEEVLGGAKDMIEHGIMDNPKVDVAFAQHILVGFPETKTGVIRYPKDTVTCSGDSMRITITGKDAHGSKSYLGVDAINIAAHTIIALQGIVAREIPSTEDSVVLVGRMEGGTTSNTQAGSAVLELSFRSPGPEERAFLRRRVEEIATSVAATFRGKATVEHLYGAAALINESALTETMAAYAREILPQEQVQKMAKMGGGEDFSRVAELVPAAFFTLGGGSVEEGYSQFLHHPEFMVNEKSLPVGAAVYAHCAMRWLEDAQ